MKQLGRVDGRVKTSHRELHRFVVDRAGDSYRAAFAYDHENWTPIYIREDLRSETLKETLPGAAERAREREAIITESEYPPLGAMTATTEIHEGGVLINFREGENEGTVVSLGAEAARRLTGFVTECLHILEAPSVQRYQTSSTGEELARD